MTTVAAAAIAAPPQPLTIAQRGLWMASFIAPPGSTFNIAEAIELPGEIDEAAFVSDALLDAISPSLAASNGALWFLSSAGEQKGFFYQTWASQPAGWKLVRATAADWPAIWSILEPVIRAGETYTLDADMLRVDRLFGFQIVQPARCTPSPGAQRSPVIGFACLALVGQANNALGETSTVVGLNTGGIERGIAPACGDQLLGRWRNGSRLRSSPTATCRCRRPR